MSMGEPTCILARPSPPAPPGVLPLSASVERPTLAETGNTPILSGNKSQERAARMRLQRRRPENEKTPAEGRGFQCGDEGI